MFRFLLTLALLLLHLQANPQMAPRAEYIALASSQKIEELWPSLVAGIATNSAPRLRDHIVREVSNSPELSEERRAHALQRVLLVLSRAESELQARLSEVGGKTFLDYMVLAVYPKYITPEEAGSLAAFYSSPVGAKMLRLTPTLISERRANPNADPVAKYFSAQEVASLEAFARRPEARKMTAAGGKVKEEMNLYFIDKTGPLVEQIASKYASQAMAAPR